MSKKLLFALWGGLFILCAGLGFIPGFSQNVSAGAQAVLTVLAVAFFAPPACLIYGAKKEKDARTLKLVRGISLLSLGLTLLALVLNVLSAMGTVTMGNALFAVLIVVSSPMVCSGYWALSLFLWACLMLVFSASISAAQYFCARSYIRTQVTLFRQTNIALPRVHRSE